MNNLESTFYRDQLLPADIRGLTEQSSTTGSLVRDAYRVARILGLISMADCADDRDKIYGALGIIRLFVEPSDIPLLIPAVDYLQTADELYLESR